MADELYNQKKAKKFCSETELYESEYEKPEVIIDRVLKTEEEINKGLRELRRLI